MGLYKLFLFISLFPGVFCIRSYIQTYIQSEIKKHVQHLPLSTMTVNTDIDIQKQIKKGVAKKTEHLQSAIVSLQRHQKELLREIEHLKSKQVPDWTIVEIEEE
jgi:hypothetical protein